MATSISSSAVRARPSAKAPTPTTISGRKFSTVCLSARSQISSNRLSFIRRQLVRSAVAAALLEEGQWTVVGDEETGEETLRSAEGLPCPSPQPGAADLGTGAGEAHPSVVSGARSRAVRSSASIFEPVADRAHLAKRHPGLGHPPRSGVHAEEQNLFRRLAVAFEVLGVGLPRVVERVVDVRYRRREPEAIYILA